MPTKQLTEINNADTIIVTAIAMATEISTITGY